MSRTLRTVLVAVVALVAVGGYWKLVLAPKRAEAAALSTQIATQQAELAQTQSLIVTYRQAEQAYRTNYTTVVRLGKAIPADDDVRSLMVQLDASAKRSGATFENLDVASSGGAGASTGSVATTAASSAAATLPPGAVSVGGFAAMPFTFSFSGQYETLSRLFARLARYVTVQNDRINVTGRLLRIESIDLSAADKGWPGIRAAVTASSYIVPAGEALGSASAATSTPATPPTTTTSTPATTASTTGPTGATPTETTNR